RCRTAPCSSMSAPPTSSASRTRSSRARSTTPLSVVLLRLDELPRKPRVIPGRFPPPALRRPLAAGRAPPQDVGDPHLPPRVLVEPRGCTPERARVRGAGRCPRRRRGLGGAGRAGGAPRAAPP